MASRGTLKVWSEGSLRWPEERVRRAGQMSSEASRMARRARRSVRGVQRSRLLVSLTSSERALIEEGARLRGVSMSRFVVEAALHPVTTSEGIAGAPHVEELIELLRAYRRQLEGAMTNLNQVAHHANAMREVPEDFASVVAGVADTIEDINARLDGVRR